jgi:hypothetical protein
MGGRKPAPEATEEQSLSCENVICSVCGKHMAYAYDNWRKVVLLEGRVVQLQLKIRRCVNKMCERYHKPYRPEAEGRWALRDQEFGLEVIAQVGAQRYQDHRSVPEIHTRLRERRVEISQRSVTNLLDRYDEILAVSLMDSRRLQRVFKRQKRVILAIDGLQPDVGHEVLWVIRECVSGEILLARPLLSSTTNDLATLLKEVQTSLPEDVEITGVISDGQQSIRNAVKQALPEVPHQLCQYHYLREAAQPIYDADRHAKKELKKLVRGVRPIERRVEDRVAAPAAGVADQLAMADVVHDYCAAVRGALTDDGRAPLESPGLKLRQRLSDISDSLDQAEKRGAHHYQKH